MGHPPAAGIERYRRLRSAFSWDRARAELDGLPDGGLNIAHEAVHRHVARGAGHVVAIRWLGRGGDRRELTYADLARASARCSGALAGLGVGAGDRVATLLGRTSELYVTAMGVLGSGAVLCPLFTAFGPEPVRERLDRSRAAVLVTTPALFERKVRPIVDRVPSLRDVVVTGSGPPPPGTRSFDELVAAAEPRAGVAPTRAEDPALLHFTSGTTGAPKGAVHVHGAVVAHRATAAYALDLRPGDVYWCTADPGWVTGTSYGIIAPLTLGVTMVVDEADLEAERWYGILQDEGVTVWYTAPTAIRMLERSGAALARTFDLGALRFVASVGEPLEPEAIAWAREALDRPIHDGWWQTETGSIMVANHPSVPIRPGSMGLPVPGIETSVLARDDHGDLVLGDDGEPVGVSGPGVQGELAIRAG